MSQSRIISLPEDCLNLKGAGVSIKDCPGWEKFGKIVQLVGNMLEAGGVEAALGDIFRITSPGSQTPIYAQVVGFHQKRLKLSPLTALDAIQPGALVSPCPQAQTIAASPGLLGRILDGMGHPIDDRGPLPPGSPYSLTAKVVNPLRRPLISEQLDVGVRSVNGLLPLGKGQRMGIFAGSGVGKSTLLGMMARHTTAPVNVIALIGERGREVNEFIEKELGRDGLDHSVVVVATSNQPATIRLRGAYLACAIAEYFRDQGHDVLFMMDSVTRFAMAAREIGLAAGEPPTSKGYTPSVFGHMPQLLERAGNFENASITGIYTVLVEGDDLEDPIADALRSILDGHIVLDRKLAHQHQYPAINVLKSVSRLTDQLLSKGQRLPIAHFVQTLARYENSEDMINIGAYVAGTNSETDYAIAMYDELCQYLRQPVDEMCSIAEAQDALAALFQSESSPD
jgi:flagellum-specific ATP synthase